MNESAPIKVWGLAASVWHWLFAICIVGLLYNGAVRRPVAAQPAHAVRLHDGGAGDLSAAVGDLGWAACPLPSYRVGPRAFFGHFRGGRADDPHTAPGRAMAIALVVLAGVQGGHGVVCQRCHIQ